MSLHKKAPLRQLSGQEQKSRHRSVCRSRIAATVEVIRAKILAAVARGADY
jgi:hypothetical protein